MPKDPFSNDFADPSDEKPKDPAPAKPPSKPEPMQVPVEEKKGYVPPPPPPIKPNQK